MENLFGEDIQDRFRRDGFIILPRALLANSNTGGGNKTTVVDDFILQLFQEFAMPTIHTEAGAKQKIKLDDKKTYPTHGERKIFEVCAPGIGSHWQFLENNKTFNKTVDALFGQNKWTFSLNQDFAGACKVRHWYSPIVFPERGQRSIDGCCDDDENNIEETWFRKREKIFATKRHKLKFISLLNSNKSSCQKILDAAAVKETSSASSKFPSRDLVLICLHAFHRCLSHSSNKILRHKKPKRFVKISSEKNKNNNIEQRKEGKKCRDDDDNNINFNFTLSFRADEIYGRNAIFIYLRAAASSISFYPVNRRRVLGKGYHVDLGPGFDARLQRNMHGHPMQGLILLVLLSDSHEGAGGTFFVRRSHQTLLRKKLFAAVKTTNEDLNNYAQQAVQDLITTGDLYLSYEKPLFKTNIIEQIVSGKGSIVILHPWVIHGGTSNHNRDNLRIMMNGMIRYSEDAYVNHGMRILDNENVCKVGKSDSTNSTTETIRYLDENINKLYSDKTYSRNLHQQSASLIMPVHNGELWLDESLSSIFIQNYKGPIEVSFYDDSSTDSSFEKMLKWLMNLRYVGIDVRISKKNVQASVNRTERADGIGFAKNRAIENSSGSILVFFDADDVMLSDRVTMQIRDVVANPSSIIGTSWKRFPQNSTEHYQRWANTILNNDMILEQFRENTVQMPTWAMTRKCFDDVKGGFNESSPQLGEAEDTKFFHKHLSIHGMENEIHSKLSLLRSGSHDIPLLRYRWTSTSGTSRVPRRRLLEVRVSLFEERILKRPLWSTFQIWGCGRDAKNFIAALSNSSRKKIAVLLDLDPQKIGKRIVLSSPEEEEEVFSLPIEHFSSARSGVSTVVCVSKRRKGEYLESDELEQNVSSLGLVEGETLWYLF